MELTKIESVQIYSTARVLIESAEMFTQASVESLEGVENDIIERLSRIGRELDVLNKIIIKKLNEVSKE